MLNLTIEPTQCILDGISLYESIDISILDKLINSKLLKTTFNNKICANIFANEKEQLIKYKALFKKINHAVIKYKRSKGNPYGRSNPEHGLGLHNLRREIRQTLTKGRFRDIDIKNCHPVILLQLIQHAGIPTIQLKSYVENRQDWFNLITGAYQCTEEQAKTLMILYTYGGGFKKWIDKEKLDESFEELPELTAFKNEVRHYHGVITRRNSHLEKVAKKIKDESGLIDITNVEGTVCAYFLQEYEVRILETLYNYCIENNVIKNRVAVLCADGMMIEAESYNESLLTIFNEIVKEKIGFDLTFVEKPMTQDYLDILDINVIPEPLPEPVIDIKIDYADIIPKDLMYMFSGITGLDENYKKTSNPNSFGDFTIASVVAKKYGERFVCASIKNNIWYEFNNHKWSYCDSGHSLKAIISGDFYDCLKKVYILIKEKYINKYDEEQLKKYKIVILFNQLVQIMDRVLKSSELKNIMTEIKGILYQEKFIEKLDTNSYLLCCSNGVIDIKQKLFREGRPEDMCSLSTNIPYLTADEVNEEYNDEATELADFFDKLMPFESMRTYLLEHTAGSLIGMNSSQTFNNFIGVGANGKSTFINLTEKTFGDYFTTVPSTLITQKKPSIGGASPEIASLRGVRYAIMQEPSKGETMNEGIMKQLTGETSNKGLTGRFLFQDSISFMPMFSMGVCTNVKLNIKSNDSGTWRRIRLVEFNSIFANKGDDGYDEHNPLCFRKNINLNMEKLAIPFLSFLVNCVFETQGVIKECEMITNATNEYRFQQDRVGRFIREVVVPCNGATTNKNMISSVCNQWFETNYKFRINNSLLFEELDKTYECLRGSYHGFNIITDNISENIETKEQTFIKQFKRQFSITNDKNDFIKSVEICEWAKMKSLKVNTSKAINLILLNEYKLDSKNKEHYKTKKINGKPEWCWFGIKKNDAVKEIEYEKETTAEYEADEDADTDVEIYEEEVSSSK